MCVCECSCSGNGNIVPQFPENRKIRIELKQIFISVNEHKTVKFYHQQKVDALYFQMSCPTINIVTRPLTLR